MSECPTCGKLCKSERGMKIHHAKIHNESLALKTVECVFCGTEFERYDSEIERGEYGPFCNKECGGKFLKEKWEKEGHPNTGRSSEEWTPSGEEHPFYGITGEDHPAYGHEHSEETIEKISEHSSGENNPFYGQSHSEETKEHLSKVSFTEDHPLYGKTGKEHPSYGKEHSEETKELMSEKSEGYKSAGKEFIVEETGNKVRSTWEGEIDKMLNSSELEYSYEGRGFGFSSEKYNSYLPDFIIEDKIILEVKGRIWNDSCTEKPELFMEQYEDYTFVAVGEEIPCHVHIPWNSREELVKEVKNILS